MPAIVQTNAAGKVTGWIIDRTLTRCARRALLGGQSALAVQLMAVQLMAMRRDGAPRGATYLGNGFTLIAGEGVA